MEQKSYHMTKQPEHCYLCEHRAEIEQGDFYCGLDEKNHCLLGADFPTDCPLQKGGQMKPIKAEMTDGGTVYRDGEKIPSGLVGHTKPVLICDDPSLTEEEINALKSWMGFCIEHPAQFETDKHFDTAYPKLLKMAGILE
jgi:hypothetical protein